MQPQLLAVARERYGREINQGPFGIDSRPALIGAKYAESRSPAAGNPAAGNPAAGNPAAAYHAAVMAAYWQEARDIGDRAVLADIAEAVGLERDEFLAALDDPAFDAQVQADIDLAHAYGLNGVPALVFDNRYLVSGAQPPDVLRRIVTQIAAEG